MNIQALASVLPANSVIIILPGLIDALAEVDLSTAPLDPAKDVDVPAVDRDPATGRIKTPRRAELENFLASNEATLILPADVTIHAIRQMILKISQKADMQNSFASVELVGNHFIVRRNGGRVKSETNRVTFSNTKRFGK